MKFFRKIRLKNLAEKKIGKYLIYAIGEIVLVVIGILIALAANNYNEEKKAKKQSKAILEEMLVDLQSDTIYLSKMLPVLTDQLEDEEWLTNKPDFDFMDIDSIKIAVKNIKWTFEINDRSFRNLLNLSENRLTGYEKLYNDISKYYVQTKGKIDLNNKLEFQKSSVQGNFDQVISENLFIENRQYDGYAGIKVTIGTDEPNIVGDFSKIKKSLNQIETKNSLNEKYARHNFIWLELFFCDLEAKKLIKQIKNSLVIKVEQ